LIISSGSATTATAAATTTLAGKTSTPQDKLRNRALALLIFIGVSAFFLPKWMQPSSFNPGIKCLDANNVPLEINKQALNATSFTTSVPKGCSVLVIKPDTWSMDWSWQQVGQDHAWKVYLKYPEGDWIGPIGWGDKIATHLPSQFLMQGTEDGEKIIFTTNHK
jgi:hypothetical protein